MKMRKRKRRKAHGQKPFLSLLMITSILWADLAKAGISEGRLIHAVSTGMEWETDVETSGISLGKSAQSASVNVPEQELTSEEPLSFVEVEQSYLDDALFIGDSRVVGVERYSGWDNLTYYAESGITIYDMFDCQVSSGNAGKVTLEEALRQNSFGKIYLEVGINEMGTGTAASFLEAYEAAVCRLRKLQPDALLFLCGIMCVEQGRSETDPIFNNPGIRERNEGIARLADGQSIFYLDINEAVADENGNLDSDYTWDDVHLLGKYNVLWMDYFCRHGIIKE